MGHTEEAFGFDKDRSRLIMLDDILVASHELWAWAINNRNFVRICLLSHEVSVSGCACSVSVESNVALCGWNSWKSIEAMHICIRTGYRYEIGRYLI